MPDEKKRPRKIYKQLILNHLECWKVTTDKRLLPILGLGNDDARTLYEVLYRIRKDGYLKTLKVEDENIHFHFTMERHAARLEPLSSLERKRSLLPWGLQHHLYASDLGVALKREFPNLQITPNLYPGNQINSIGSLNQSDKRYAPDIVLTNDQDGSRTYIEAELNTKPEIRYRQRWSAYENDPSVSHCVYWTDTRKAEQRLKLLMTRFTSGAPMRSDFFLGVALHCPSTPIADALISTFGANSATGTVVFRELIDRISQMPRAIGG